MKAWIENGKVRDIAQGNPSEIYHPDVAALYTVEVPDGTVSGATLVAGVWTNPPPPPPPDPVVVEAARVAAVAVQAAAFAKAMQELIVTATQSRLDTFGQTRNYDGILSACTYASSGVVKFAKEGQYAVNARDATWSALYTLLAEVQAGTKPMPTSFADVEPLLPALAWPA